eukprot:1196420-Prorocentrum_minimum.AAC.13
MSDLFKRSSLGRADPQTGLPVRLPTLELPPHRPASRFVGEQPKIWFSTLSGIRLNWVAQKHPFRRTVRFRGVGDQKRLRGSGASFLSKVANLTGWGGCLGSRFYQSFRNFYI